MARVDLSISVEAPANLEPASLNSAPSLLPAATKPSSLRRTLLRGQWLGVLYIGCIALGVAATGVVCHAIMICFPGLSLWGMQGVLSAISLGLILLMIFKHERQWNASLRHLRSIVHDITSGEAPIDELKLVRGAMEPVAEEIAKLMRTLRQKEASMGQLNEELRQRIASRTEALERALSSTRYQSERDPLTGMLNRRGLREQLDRMACECLKSGTSLVTMAIDVDNFKMLNDTLGHAAGDDFLRNVGQLMRSTLREQDYMYRTGGDEFLVLMPGTSQSGATALAERLQSLTDALAGTLRVSARPRLCIGIASLEVGAADAVSAMLERADAALYRIKAQRRAAGQRVARAG